MPNVNMRCVNCKFWGKKQVFISNETARACFNDNLSAFPACEGGDVYYGVGSGIVTEPGFGCIQWESKDVAEASGE